MDKRGISPLIATVLLVSFVVILSGVIMFWGKQYVTELMEKRGDVAEAKLECENVDIEIKGFKKEIGELTIMNNGPKLDGFILRYSNGETENVNKVFDSYLEDSITLHFGGQKNVDVIPILRPEGINAPSIPCSSKHKLVKLT